MRIIEMNEAQDWLKKTGSEDTLVIAKNTYIDNKYDDNKTHQYEFLAMLEEKEPTEEYPDAMAIDFFGNSGWLLSEDDLAIRAEDGTLIDKIVEECGYRCGDVYLDGEKDVIDRYVEYADKKSAVFILGTDLEIQQLLPYLKDGTYCFLFESIAAIRERYFREQEREYRLSDAENVIENYYRSWRRNWCVLPADMQHHLMLRAHKIVDRFEKRYDANVDENTQWEDAVESEAQQVILDAVGNNKGIMAIINKASSPFGYDYLQAAYAKATGETIPFDSKCAFNRWWQDTFSKYVRSIGMETEYGCITDMDLKPFARFYKFVAGKVATARKAKRQKEGI